MKNYRFPRGISTLLFSLAKPLAWVSELLWRAGSFLRNTDFRPGRFICYECHRHSFGVRLLTWSGCPHREANRRVCRRCYDSVPF